MSVVFNYFYRLLLQLVCWPFYFYFSGHFGGPLHLDDLCSTPFDSLDDLADCIVLQSERKCHICDIAS